MNREYGGRRWLFGGGVALVAVLLAGCAALPGNSTGSTVASSSAIATRIAAAVAATLTTRETATATDSSVPLQVRDTTQSPTAVAKSTGSHVSHPANAATPQATDTPTHGAAPASPSATARATPPPRATATASATAVPTPVLLAPVRLAEAEVGGSPLFARYWTNAHAIRFRMAAPPGVTLGLHPQVEIEPLTHAYTGKPTAEGAALPAQGLGQVTVQVASYAEGAYHWQARLTDDHGHNGPWADFYQGPAFRLDRTPPAAPVVQSSTDPNQHATYGSPMASITWTKPADNGGIQGYQTGVDRKPNGLPTGPYSAVRSTALGPLANGAIYFHVRAEDWAGNVGPVATYILHIDHRPPALAHVRFDRFLFNPQYDHLTMHFVPDKAITVTVEIRQQQSKGLVRVLHLGHVPAQVRTQVGWDGRDYKGQLVPAGLYTMVVIGADRLGNVGDGYYSDLTVTYRRIVIHLGTQSLDAYDGNTLLRHTLVTTGNNLLPTPAGIWHITGKFHPYKFISPWKKGTLYYYPPSNVNYALYFHAGGYFIHDAPWRTVYGPGTNNAPGAPGTYSGTHGCVNVPEDVEAWLYSWAPIGTVVDIRP